MTNPNKVIRNIICYNCIPEEPEMELKGWTDGRDEPNVGRYECPLCDNTILVFLKEVEGE